VNADDAGHVARLALLRASSRSKTRAKEFLEVFDMGSTTSS
jgi:hypothetical protein